MSRFQIAAIALCFVVLLLDGFDALVMSFTGPTISDEWGLSSTSLGILFSSSLVGMAVGAVSLSALADRVGRRPVIVLSLVIVTAGMLASAFAGSLQQLALLRFLTGTGIGAALASVNIIVAEYSSKKWRGLAIGVVQTAYPLGATLGGALAVLLIERSGWEAVFLVGAAGSAVMIPVIMLYLPESLDFLVSRRTPDALQKINRQLARMGQSELDDYPPVSASPEKTGVGGLLTPAFLRSTVLLWLAFFMVMFCLYFTLNWTPKLLIESGLSTSEGISGGIVLHIGGIIGQLILGFAAGHFDLRRLLMIYYGTAVLAMIGFAFVLGELQLALVVAWLNGFFVLGAITGSYTVTHGVYPTKIRTTGLGWAIGIGRIGAIASPLIAGLMLDRGADVATLYLLFSTSMLFGMLAIMLLPRKESGRVGTTP